MCQSSQVSFFNYGHGFPYAPGISAPTSVRDVLDILTVYETQTPTKHPPSLQMGTRQRPQKVRKYMRFHCETDRRPVLTYNQLKDRPGTDTVWGGKRRAFASALFNTSNHECHVCRGGAAVEGGGRMGRKTKRRGWRAQWNLLSFQALMVQDFIK